MIHLYTSASSNGYRASLMLEECGLPYEVHAVDLATGAHKTAAFLEINPTGRIPVIVDVDDHAPDRPPVTVSETLAIALYASEKASGILMPTSLVGRTKAWQWGATIVSGFGSAIPGIFFARQLDAVAHEKLIGKYFNDIDVYLAAMEAALTQSPWLAGGTYSFADVLALPTIAVSLPRFAVDLAPFAAIRRWRDAALARPASMRGMRVPS